MARSPHATGNARQAACQAVGFQPRQRDKAASGLSSPNPLPYPDSQVCCQVGKRKTTTWRQGRRRRRPRPRSPSRTRISPAARTKMTRMASMSMTFETSQHALQQRDAVVVTVVVKPRGSTSSKRRPAHARGTHAQEQVTAREADGFLHLSETGRAEAQPFQTASQVPSCEAHVTNGRPGPHALFRCMCSPGLRVTQFPSVDRLVCRSLL